LTDIRSKADYQRFSFSKGKISDVGPRMQQKLAAIDSVIPDLLDKEVLDVGCDFGFWSFLSSERGARSVIGLDRNRPVKGLGQVDLVKLNNETAKELGHPCSFYEIDIGKQWMTYGKFDVVYLMSLYHHIYNRCGDHLPIWFWLRNQVKDNGIIIWENPVDTLDVVSFNNIEKQLHSGYNEKEILKAASVYFDAEFIGPALHEPTRIVYRFRPRPMHNLVWEGLPMDGAGGATKAFLHEEGRRMKEVENAIGYKVIPGSLNMAIDSDFDWDRNYYRSKILDVRDRSKGIDSVWSERWARFYPLTMNGIKCHAFRFEGERYPKNFVELIANVRLRDYITNKVELVQ
jgi:SAM-dependent methyltransferase